MFMLFCVLSSLIACLELNIALYNLYAIVRRSRQNAIRSLLLSKGPQRAPLWIIAKFISKIEMNRF